MDGGQTRQQFLFLLLGTTINTKFLHQGSTRRRGDQKKSDSDKMSRWWGCRKGISVETLRNGQSSSVMTNKRVIRGSNRG